MRIVSINNQNKQQNFCAISCKPRKKYIGLIQEVIDNPGLGELISAKVGKNKNGYPVFVFENKWLKPEHELILFKLFKADPKYYSHINLISSKTATKYIQNAK